MPILVTSAFLACLICLTLLAIRSPARAIGLAAFFFIFENYYDFGLTATSNELLLLAVCGGILIRLINKELRLQRLLAACLPFLPFVAALCVSAIVATSRAEAVKDVVRWLSFFAAYGAATVSIKSYEDARRLATWLAAASVPACLFGVFQSALGLPSAAFELEPHSRIDSLFCVTTGWHVRAHSFFNQANSFACYLVVVLPLCLFLASNSKTRAGKAIAAIVVGLNLIALMLTFSRASWPLAILAVLATWLLGRDKANASPRHRPRLWAGAIAIVLTLTGIGLVSFRSADLGSLLSRHSGLQRVQLWRAGLSMVSEKPFLGQGPGNYPLAASRVRMQPDEERLKRAHLHNLYLQVAVEAGALGLFAFLFFVIASVSLLIRGVRKAIGPNRRLGAALCVSGCAFFAYNLIDVFRYHGVHLVAAAIIGAGIALLGLPGPGQDNP